jgi:hypothetical protein
MVASSSKRPLFGAIVRWLDADERTGARAGLACVFPRRTNLGPRVSPVELVQQVSEAIGHALPDDVVINALKDIAQTSLILATEAACRFG